VLLSTLEMTIRPAMASHSSERGYWRALLNQVYSILPQGRAHLEGVELDIWIPM